MSPEIEAAIQPGLKPKKGDGVVWSGEMGGGAASIITWQGLSRSLREWSLSLGYFDSGLRHRLRNMPIEKAMDKTQKPCHKVVKKTPKIEYNQGVDYMFVPPAQSLL